MHCHIIHIVVPCAMQSPAQFLRILVTADIIENVGQVVLDRQRFGGETMGHLLGPERMRVVLLPPEYDAQIGPRAAIVRKGGEMPDIARLRRFEIVGTVGLVAQQLLVLTAGG